MRAGLLFLLALATACDKRDATSQADNAAPRRQNLDCEAVIPAALVTEVCGGPALSPGVLEAMGPILCERTTSTSTTADRTTVTVTDWETEASAKAMTGVSASGELATKRVERPEARQTKTTVATIKGGLVVEAESTAYDGRPAPCTDDQLRTIAKRAHGLLP